MTIVEMNSGMESRSYPKSSSSCASWPSEASMKWTSSAIGITERLGMMIGDFWDMRETYE